MAARHKMKHKAGGGAIKLSAGNPYVVKEAEEKKKGGKVIGKMDGGASKRRMDRPGRKRGGRVGADTSPLSTAHSAAKEDAAPKSNSKT